MKVRDGQGLEYEEKEGHGGIVHKLVDGQKLMEEIMQRFRTGGVLSLPPQDAQNKVVVFPGQQRGAA